MILFLFSAIIVVLFNYRSAVRRHEKQHERKEKVHCALCKGTFKDATLHKRHMKYAHKGNFSCPKCNAAFSSEAALKTHSKVHKTEAERKFRCSFLDCGKSFNFSHHLKHHVLTHSNSKQYYCNKCGKGFIQLHHLKTHIKTHEPEKWLPCTEQDCKKKFVTEYARRRHIATHNKTLNTNKLPDCNSIAESSTSREDAASCAMGEQSVLKQEENNQTLGCNGKQSYVCKINERKDNNPNANQNTTTHVLKFTNPISQGKVLLPHNRICGNNITIYNNNYIVPLEKLTKNTTDIIISDCKTVLGSCLVSGSTEISENCLCAQIYNPTNNFYKTVVEKEKINEVPVTNNVVKDNNKDLISENNNNCSDCDYVNKMKQNRVINKYDKRKEIRNLPELEYRFDGVVKIKETFDLDIKIEFKEEHTNNLKDYPMNNCKIALGKCIASEDCLCAKMMIDEEQMHAQEIAEITPLDFSY